MKTEFSRILREKIQQNTSEVGPRHSQESADRDPLHLAFLLGTLQKTAILPRKNNSYFSTKFDDTREKPSLPIPPSPPSHLSLRQKEGWLWFWKRGAPLSENYTKVELHRQYRQLAKLIHPDQNPHPKASEAFILLRQHYDVLNNFSH